MRLLVFPQLHDKHGVRVILVDSHLVGKAADLPKGLAAPRQMTHQFVALTRDCAKRSHIRKCHGPTVVGQCTIHGACLRSISTACGPRFIDPDDAGRGAV